MNTLDACIVFLWQFVPGITAINDLVSTVFHKRTLQFGSRKTFSDNLAFQRRALDHRNPLVIRGETGLSLFVTVYDEEEK